jgi:hypothetical protein
MRTVQKTLVIIFATIGILACVVVLTVLWGIHKHETAYQPLWSYEKLMKLATICDDYKKSNVVWPTNVDQLVNFRPELYQYKLKTDAYGHDIHLVPFNDATGYGELTSYGRDGKPGGDNKFDRDIIVRFPVDTETNAQWNKQLGEQFKHPLSQ